jgi:hypothetical protein
MKKEEKLMKSTIKKPFGLFSQRVILSYSIDSKNSIDSIDYLISIIFLISAYPFDSIL